MADLADIAAAAGIAIVDAPLSDGGDTGQPNTDNANAKQTILSSAVVPDGSGDSSIVFALDAIVGLFNHRYTEEDPDYAKTVSESSVTSRPPCVEGYFGRRHRDNSRPWHRDRNSGDHSYRDGRGHRGRGDYNYHGNRPHHQSYGYRGRDRSGDYYNRDRERYHHRDRSPR